MARLVTDSPVIDFQGPWYLHTAITCPFCGRTFYLTQEDTKPGTVANLGATGTRAIGWQQLNESGAIDSANLHVDPAQVKGECPYCHYYPITVNGPRFNLSKVTLNTDTNAGSIQSYITGGATKVTFHLTNSGVLVGVFLLASGAPYSLDSSGNYATAVQRLSATTLDATTRYFFGTPARVITPERANEIDAPLVAMLQRFGLVIV